MSKISPGSKIFALLSFASSAALALPAPAEEPTRPKPATEATKQANREVQAALDKFTNAQDFADAAEGLLALPEKGAIEGANGSVVWDLGKFGFINGEKAPDTVNPSLWRNAQLGMVNGLFAVTKERCSPLMADHPCPSRIYQVRGYDLSNITFIRGDTGWIVFDPLISVETAKAAFGLLTRVFGPRPIVAVVYSHSHVDHFGGVRGLVDEADVQAKKVRIIAPEHFTEHAISENVIAGNAMSRRAVYMYGAMLDKGPQGAVTAGLGLTNSLGAKSLLLPTCEITKTGQVEEVDGVKMVFQLTPGTEAPAEMNTYFPQFKALWMAENATHTMHNILTLRGAQVRDPSKWAQYLDETIELFGAEAEVQFQSHHWPVRGHENILNHLRKQRDLYKYIHDQSVNLLNKGYTGVEISNMISLPPQLEEVWSNRGHYGTLKHNSRAVYQRYMGFYDGNPSTLDQLPPEEAAKKYVAYMGGAQAVLRHARDDFAKGEYRWVAEALRHVVFADADNKDAKELLADAYEQMGYQAESGPWRSIYLQGAFELRNGVKGEDGASTASSDIIRAMPPELLFDYLSVRLDGKEAAKNPLKLNIHFTDLEKGFYALTVENGVLHYARRDANAPPAADATATLAKSTLDSIQLREQTIEEAIAKGELVVEGEKEKFQEFFNLLDRFPPNFNIVTP